MNKKHLFSLSLTLIIVMLFSALGPTTVYADDGTPPEETTTIETSGTDSEAVDEGEPGAQTDETGGEEATTEEATADETGEGEAEEVAPEPEATDETGEGEFDEAAPEAEATDETGGGETTAEEPSLMEQVPENTEIVVVNSEGEIEPLATEEAAAIVVTGDPMWCPEGVAPQAGVDGCSDPGDGNANYDPTSLESLLAYLATFQPDGPGTIWIEDSYDSSVNDSSATGFTLDSITFDEMMKHNLTIQGGWDGTSGSTAITGTSSFDVPIVIGSESNPWGGWLTIRNITISGVVNDVGLTVYTAAGVIVEDSEFINNDAAGVFIDAGGDVDVRRSKVDDNGSNSWNVVDGKGLEIKSGGYVTLANVTANDNQIFGADVESVEGVTIADSTFNGNLMYTPELVFYGYGLTVVSQGDIVLGGGIIENNVVVEVGVEANGNYLWGAWLDGPNVFIENSTFNRNISDSDLYIDDTGLIIVTTGNATLDFVEANENRMIGADIYANGQVDIANSSFNSNFGTTLDASDAETYWGCGLQVSGVPVGGVTVGVIQNCDPQTLPAASINLNTVTANGNYLYGADLLASGDVNISGSSFSNNATPAPQANARGGLMVKSDGAVALDTVTVNANGMFGAEIIADGDIYIEASSFFNNQNGFGLSAKSTDGSIYLDTVTASSVGGDGAILETADAYVCLDNVTFSGNDQNGYGLRVINSTYEVTEIAGPSTIDNIFTSGSTSGECPQVSFGSISVTNKQPAESTQYTVTNQTEGQLPSALGQGNTFVAALKVTSQATNLAIELSFPVPAGMESANLVVMFWDGSQWVEVPGGSIVNGKFVITVTQPGIYVLVSQ